MHRPRISRTPLRGLLGAGLVVFLPVLAAAQEVVHEFAHPPRQPNGTLVESGGAFYGATRYGGEIGAGTIFRLGPTPGEFTVVAEFDGLLLKDAAGGLCALGGMLYGTTQDTFPAPGSLYRFDPVTSVLTEVANFGGANGVHPNDAPIAVGAVLYGVTSSGGPANRGTVYRFDPAGPTLSTVAALTNADGFSPGGRLLAHGGFLYGATGNGGAQNKGTNETKPRPAAVIFAALRQTLG